MTSADWAQRWQDALMDNYGTPPVMLVRGRGARVWDSDGREYVDLLAGIAVNALGHADPRIVGAVSAQLATLGHTSNLAATEPAIALAEKLVTLFDDPQQATWTQLKAKGTCRRNPAAGPGTCGYWWDGCPKAEQRGCFQLFAKLHEGKSYAVDGGTVKVVSQ